MFSDARLLVLSSDRAMFVQLTNSSRNLVFGVAGIALGHGSALPSPAWMDQCQRYHTIPRDIKPDPATSLLRIAPIPEIASLRNGSTRNITAATQVGAQVEVVLSCSGVPRGSAAGSFGVDVLATADAKEYTRLGVNVTRADADAPPTAFVDTSHTTASAVNQSAYHNPGTNTVPLWQLHSSNARDERNAGPMEIQITVLVDGGMIEAFFGEQCPITTLVQPSRASPPGARYARPFNTAKGVACEAAVSRLVSLV